MRRAAYRGGVTEERTVVTEPVREFREHLHLGLGRLRSASEAIRTGELKAAPLGVEYALAYLEGLLLPAFKAEEFTLFPAIDGVIGSTGATEVMVAQHRAIEAMVGDLRKVADAATTDGNISEYAGLLLPLLHGLYAAVRMHLESEEDAYLGLLDEHLSESQADVIAKNLFRISTNSVPESQRKPAVEH